MFTKFAIIVNRDFPDHERDNRGTTGGLLYGFVAPPAAEGRQKGSDDVCQEITRVNLVELGEGGRVGAFILAVGRICGLGRIGTRWDAFGRTR